MGDCVLSRAHTAIYLVAAEAKYHHDCRRAFFLETGQDKKTKGSHGRLVDEKNSVAFEELCVFLDSNDECQYSLGELVDHVDNFLEGGEGYTYKQLKSKLSCHHGDNITITCIPGKSSILTFKDVAHKILQGKWYTERCADENDERIRIVKMAASIIRDDIRLRPYNCDEYSAPSFVEKGGCICTGFS